MLWVPSKGRLLVEHNLGAVGITTLGTSVTTGTPAATKGTAVQIYAATLFDAYWVTILASAYGGSAVASEGCLDILTGAATEEVLIPNLLMGYSANPAQAGFAKRWDFPLYIPGGSRIAARTAGARLTTASRVAVLLYGGQGMPPFRVGSKVTTYGVTTVPNGVAITPGASGAEGAWTEITAATSEDHFCLVPSFQAAVDTTTTQLSYALDLGIGAATEKMIAESYMYVIGGNETMGGPINSMPCFQDIPSGTRLVMRVSNSGVNDSNYNGAIHGVS